MYSLQFLKALARRRSCTLPAAPVAAAGVAVTRRCYPRFFSSTTTNNRNEPSAASRKAKAHHNESNKKNHVARSILDDVDRIMKEERKRSLLAASTPTNNRNEEKEDLSMMCLSSSTTTPTTTTTSSSASTSRTNDGTFQESGSFFDVFALPPNREEEEEDGQQTNDRPPDALDKIACQSYLDILNPIIETDPKFRRLHTSKPIPLELAQPVMDWLREERPIVPIDIPTLQQALSMGTSILDDDSSSSSNSNGQSDTTASSITSCAQQVSQQRERFCQQLGLTSPKKQWDMIRGALYQCTSQCAKHGVGTAAPVLWQKVQEAGIMDRSLLQNLLYVSLSSCYDTTSTDGIRTSKRRKRAKYARLVGRSILDELDDIEEAAAEEEENNQNENANDNDDDNVTKWMDTTDKIAIYHDLLHQPTEQSVHIRVKLLVATGQAKEAEALLDQHAATQIDLRLRAYLPVLRLHLELKDMAAALALYKKKMRSMPLVHLDVETYIHLLAGLAENGCFAPNAPAIAGATEELGYTSASGPALLDEILAEMAQDVIEIPTTSAKRLYNALAQGFPNSNLTPTTSMAPLKLATAKAQNTTLIANRVQIDSATGLCPRSGVMLRLIHLSGEERDHLKKSILELARTEQLAFLENVSKNSMNKNNKKRLQKNHHRAKHVRADDGLKEFLNVLDTRQGQPFTAIVDGPNVGYYMQNYETGRFSVHQIQFVVDSLESMGEHPLVVLPQKYASSSFNVTIGYMEAGKPRRQHLTPEEVAIRDNLVRSGKVYVVPHGFLDDFYWILASISSQSTACKGQSLYVTPENPQGRWPGARPILISNDQMRDHKIGMMEPRLFRRWFSNFIVNYSFAAFVDGDCPHPEIGFAAADAFSREIQGNSCSDGSMAWHFPIQDTEDEWFCIRIPKR